MKTDFKFSNLCGTVYRKGNIVFSSGRDALLSPVGNRVTCFDLKNNKSVTLPFETSKNISKLCLSPNNNVLLSVDEDGKCVLFSLHTNSKLDFFNFKKKVYDIKYSPNGKYIAVTFGRGVQIWHAPGSTREFAPLTLLRSAMGAYDDVKCINWSTDSRFILFGGKDMTARVVSLHKMKNFKNWVLTGHRNVIVNCFFVINSVNCYTVSKDGAVFVWQCDRSMTDFEVDEIKRKHQDDDEESTGKDNNGPTWSLESKHFFHQDNTQLTSAEFHQKNNLLVVGFSSGLFMLYEMPDFIQIHSLSITQHKINSIGINHAGDWLAFGSASLGQLLVWEWQSESYVLKQQGHFYDMSVMAYSPDGQLIATGGEDRKVKVWNTFTGFCFVTFNQHSAGVTGVEFSQNGQVIVSASLDGTVRAFDLNRYRNFRTFTAPKPCQFSSLALDASAEIICAGSLDTFEICMWSMQTGRLLEVLSGHEGPVSCLSFSPIKSILASGSWDNTVRLWDVYTQTTPKEVVTIGSNVLALCYRPDGYEIAVSSINGEIKFWQPQASMQVGSIEGRKDLMSGRRKTDLVTAKKLADGKAFSSLCYSSDGECILAGGKSKYVCIYHVSQQILLKRFEISCNKSLDGMKQYLNSRNMTEAGPLDMIDMDRNSDESDNEDNTRIRLPGVAKGDMSSRRTQPEIQTKSLRFSPTGRSWAAATTEGLLIFSRDGSLSFAPEELSMDITPDTILKFVREKQHSQALLYACRLNEEKHLLRVVENIQIQDIPVIVQGIREQLLLKVLTFLAKQLEESPHLQFYLQFVKQILTTHGSYIKKHSRTVMPVLRLLQKSLSRHTGAMAAMCDSNYYTLQYLLSKPAGKKIDNDMDEDAIEDDDTMDE